jgi:hypothetical protein
MRVSVAKNDRWHLALFECNHLDRYRHAGLALLENDVFHRVLANYTTVLDRSEYGDNLERTDRFGRLQPLIMSRRA